MSDFQSAHASIKIAEAGLAKTISPWDDIYSHVANKRITARKIVNPSVERTVCLISSLRSAPSFATTAIVGVIKEAIDDARREDKLRGEPVLN
ncbi:MAG: hypothetical protein HOJ88_00625 [Proteobacteria bacterium]|nr:hypothetical protein [Pseudomonadota bacterium]